MTVPPSQGAEGVVLCGSFGTGKTSVAEEIAVRFEHSGVPFAAIDLDWLSWFGTDDVDPHTDGRVFLANLSAVVRNYLDVGVQRFILAGSVRGDVEVDAMRSAVGFRLRLVELRAPWPVIERRLRASPTTGRLEDLEDARADRDDGRGPTTDAVVDSDRTLAEVATEVLEQLGWSGSAT